MEHERRLPVAALRAGMIFGCVGALLTGGCHRPEQAAPAVMIEAELAPQPVTVGPAMVTVSVRDGQGAPITRATLTVEGDMSHPGMSPIFADASELGGGRYEAKMSFGMAGDWVLLLHLKLPDGRAVERQVDVRGVRAR